MIFKVLYNVFSQSLLPACIILQAWKKFKVRPLTFTETPKLSVCLIHGESLWCYFAFSLPVSKPPPCRGISRPRGSYKLRAWDRCLAVRDSPAAALTATLASQQNPFGSTTQNTREILCSLHVATNKKRQHGICYVNRLSAAGSKLQIAGGLQRWVSVEAKKKKSQISKTSNVKTLI